MAFASLFSPSFIPYSIIDEKFILPVGRLKALNGILFISV